MRHSLPLHLPDAAPPRRAGVTLRVGLLLAVAIALAAGLAARGPLPQPEAYHHFADRRALVVPNAGDVLSNLGFAVAGVAGLLALRRARLRDPRERRPWQIFFAGVSLTSLGSAWYHLAPDNGRLVWDRLPMAIAFMALLAALVAERLDARAGARLLWPLVALGVASVGWWHLTELAGRGDLRPYLFVQFYPLLALAILLLLPPRAYDREAAWLGALGCYVLAKLAEAWDARLFAMGGLVGGHALKHLLAAAGIGALAWMVARRRPVMGG